MRRAGSWVMRLAYVCLPGHGAVDPVLVRASELLQEAGVRLAGAVQIDLARADRSRCDMGLRLLPDGPVLNISADRGPQAKGCHLDTDALERAAVWVADVVGAAQMLIVNKFGKQEAEGRGLAPSIAEALSRGQPVLLGVNEMNLPAFLEFAGGFEEALPAEPVQIADWALNALRAPAAD